MSTDRNATNDDRISSKASLSERLRRRFLQRMQVRFIRKGEAISQQIADPIGHRGRSPYVWHLFLYLFIALASYIAYRHHPAKISDTLWVGVLSIQAGVASLATVSPMLSNLALMTIRAQHGLYRALTLTDSTLPQISDPQLTEGTLLHLSTLFYRPAMFTVIRSLVALPLYGWLPLDWRSAVLAGLSVFSVAFVWTLLGPMLEYRGWLMQVIGYTRMLRSEQEGGRDTSPFEAAPASPRTLDDSDGVPEWATRVTVSEVRDLAQSEHLIQEVDVLDLCFLSETHERAFRGLVYLFFDGSEAGETEEDVMRNNREAGPALYVLAALRYKGEEVRRQIGRGRVAFTALLDASATWSSGEQALLRLAAHLFNHTEYPFPLLACLADLDEQNFEAAAHALRWRFDRLGGYVLRPAT